MMPRQGASPADRLLLLLTIGLFVVGGVVFARAQNVWVDETTQLSGISLPLGRMIAWLTGAREPALGVPPDRMPPISYIVDAAFWRLWGDNLFAFRMLHLAIAVAGLAVLLDAVRFRIGVAAMVVAGLLLTLLPKLTDQVVEIRSYTMLFALSCGQVAMVLRRRDKAGWSWIVAFAALGLISSYTHFFGVVATSAFFVALFVASESRAAALRIIAVYAALLLLWAGLIPFVTGAASASAALDRADMSLGGVVTYLLKLIGHSANLLTWQGAALLFGGALLLAAMTLAGLAWQARREGDAVRRDPVVILVVALIAGLGATLAAGLVVIGFNPTKPSYSVWMIPVIATVIGAAFAKPLPGRIAAGARVLAAAIMLIGAAWGQWDFLSRADWFAHGPEVALSRAVTSAGPRTAVVYIGPAWAFGYYPQYWRRRDALDQWLLADDGQGVHRIARGGDPSGPAQPLATLDRYDAIVVARIDLSSYRDFRSKVSGTAIAEGAIVDQGFPDRHWSAGQAVATPGFIALTTQTIVRQAEGARQ